MSAKGKVLLAYSGGLDTSTILAWLIDEGYDVVAFMANVGQIEDFEAARTKALKCGAKDFILEDMRREFIEELIYPAVQVNAIYEDVYLLGTSLARPVIARGMIESAAKTGCQYVAHGCTGKGNDQVRFELAFYGLKPDIKVIAPWRDASFYNRFAGRSALLEYAASKGIPVAQTKAKPWSTDENAMHCSYEAGVLEDPVSSLWSSRDHDVAGPGLISIRHDDATQDHTPPEDMWGLIKSPEKAPDTPEHITLTFTKGLPTKVKIQSSGKEVTDSVEIFDTLNLLAREHGIGRVDIVENRLLGLKSRGCYETPAGTILRTAHISLEGLVMDKELRKLRDSFLSRSFSQQLYDGLYYSPECEFVRSAIPASQKNVNGDVRLKLYKGNTIVEGRSSSETLYSADAASMDVVEGFDVEAAGGFIATSSIRLKAHGLNQTRKGLGGVDKQAAHAGGK